MLTSKQKEILIGGLLGDLSLEKPKKSNNCNTRFKIERSIKDLKYLEWQQDQFKEITSKINTYNRLDKRYNKIYSSCYLRSKALSELNELYYDWYDGKKHIPRNFKLTPLTLAVWFADDGCITKYSDKHYTVKFSTECFTPEDVDYLISLLMSLTKSSFKKYRKYPDKDHFIIKGSTKSAVSVINICKSHLIDMGMERKVK